MGSRYQESPSGAIVRAVAEAEGCEPGKLTESLYDAIDPDAIDALFGPDAVTDGRVEFTYCGYDVIVDSDGTIELEESD